MNRITYIDEWDLPPVCRRRVVGGRLLVAGRRPTLEEVAQAIQKAQARNPQPQPPEVTRG